MLCLQDPIAVQGQWLEPTVGLGRKTDRLAREDALQNPGLIDHDNAIHHNQGYPVRGYTVATQVETRPIGDGRRIKRRDIRGIASIPASPRYLA